MPVYFFDTYAIIEILKGNSNYAKYSNEEIVITIFNLVELYWFAVKEYSSEDADKILERYRLCVVEVSNETIKDAINFKKKNKNSNLSYSDCIGYAYSSRNNLKFLTGDKEFNNIKNVEFVK